MQLLSLAALVACSTPNAREARSPATWERPGLAGAVRPEMGAPQPGMTAPDFELPSLRAESSTRLSSLRGSWVILHFTASWCPYCDSEVAHLGEVADAYASRNVKVVLVDVKEDEAQWRAYATERVSPSVLAVLDATGEAAESYAPPHAQTSFEDRANVVLDSTIIIDSQGKISLFLLPDSAHFDPTFVAVRRELDAAIGQPSASEVIQARTFEPPALRSEDVVSISASHGDHAVDVSLRIAPGYHVMSDRPSSANFIATQVTVTANGTSFGPAEYPPAKSLSLGTETIETFDGETHVVVPYAGAFDANARSIEVSVRYQACTRSRCLFPITRTTRVELPLAPPAAVSSRNENQGAGHDNR